MVQISKASHMGGRSSSVLRKFLAGLIIVDALIAIWIIAIAGNWDPRLLIGWAVLNVVIAISALAIIKSSSRRKGSSSLQARHTRYYYSPSQEEERHTRDSDDDYNSDFHRAAYITMNGETVKSKGEKLLADYFYQNNIVYQYERAAWTTGTRFKSKRMISKPDFYLPDYDVYVEYWGMVNTKDKNNRADYIKSMEWKMTKYDENKIKFVSIYPNNLDDLDRIFKARLRKATTAVADAKRDN
jgi:hypothetical protein